VEAARGSGEPLAIALEALGSSTATVGTARAGMMMMVEVGGAWSVGGRRCCGLWIPHGNGMQRCRKMSLAPRGRHLVSMGGLVNWAFVHPVGRR
jgi:hypothetical protein